MRRAVVWFTTITVAMVLVGGGVALAKTIFCDGGRCVGTNRPDTMYGTNRHDAMHGKNGGDYLAGYRWHDNLNGQRGNDAVYGGRGNDWVRGDRHNDVVKGDLGNDRIAGGSGRNTLRAGDGMRDLIICGANSHNFIYFDPGLDRFSSCRFKKDALKGKADEERASITAWGPKKDDGS